MARQTGGKAPALSLAVHELSVHRRIPSPLHRPGPWPGIDRPTTGRILRLTDNRSNCNTKNVTSPCATNTTGRAAPQGAGAQEAWKECRAGPRDVEQDGRSAPGPYRRRVLPTNRLVDGGARLAPLLANRSSEVPPTAGRL